MDDKTLEALKGSIAKWEGILVGTTEDHGTDNCPLCQLFYCSGQAYCIGCPVNDKTGLTFCGGSPYADFEECEVEFSGKIKNDDHRIIAKAELAFLQSLLPQKEADATVS